MMDGILCINKPANMTSFDVIKVVRKRLNAKIGHSGTLDPMASGVLIVAVNKATKALPYLGLDDKVYRAELKLGLKTTTGDIWGQTLIEKQPQDHTIATIQQILQRFIGTQHQRVPKVSAKKIAGRKSYDYVFKGEAVATLYTDIEIYDLEFLDYQKDTLSFRAHVSKGTYIRTLCEDIAEKLGEVGTMSSLIREQVGKYSLDDALSLEELAVDVPLIATKSALAVPILKDVRYEEQILHGKRIELDTDYDEVCLDAGAIFAIYRREKDQTFKSVRGLW